MGRIDILQRNRIVINIVKYMLKAKTGKPAETSVARERLCKHASC
jgi:hypothetical protein